MQLNQHVLISFCCTMLVFLLPHNLRESCPPYHTANPHRSCQLVVAFIHSTPHNDAVWKRTCRMFTETASVRLKIEIHESGVLNLALVGCFIGWCDARHDDGWHTKWLCIWPALLWWCFALCVSVNNVFVLVWLVMRCSIKWELCRLGIFVLIITVCGGGTETRKTKHFRILKDALNCDVPVIGTKLSD